MKPNLLTLGLLTSMTCMAAQDNSINFITQIESIKVNRSAINEQGTLVRAERIYVSGDTPCGKDTIHVNAGSVQMTQENYEKFIREIWHQARMKNTFASPPPAVKVRVPSSPPKLKFAVKISATANMLLMTILSGWAAMLTAYMY